MIDPDQPTRSASTVAGISGYSANNARTRGSNGVNDVGPGVRSYFGGADDATAFTTVVREIPNRSAIRVFGTPSAASLRINAQSSKVITLQSSSVHFSPSILSSFRASSTAIEAFDDRTSAEDEQVNVGYATFEATGGVEQRAGEGFLVAAISPWTPDEDLTARIGYMATVSGEQLGMLRSYWRALGRRRLRSQIIPLE